MALPKELVSLRAWLVWRLKQVEGEPKPRKIPYYASGVPRSGVQGSQADRAAMVTLSEAVSVAKAGKYTGVGLAMLSGQGLVGLDFDNCVKDGVIDPQVSNIVEGMYTEFSPSGTGIRSFALGELKSGKDNAPKHRKNPDGSRKDGKFDIEFFGDSGFLTVTGKQTHDSEMFGWPIAPLNDTVLTLYKERITEHSRPSVAGMDTDLLSESPTQGWTLGQARAYLEDCDPSTARENWLKVLMALHHEFDGSDDALDLADEWSSKGDSYGGRADVEQRWNSFKGATGRSPITASWLLFWRAEQLKREKYTAEEEHVTTIKGATDAFFLREKLCQEIRGDLRLDSLAREQIAQALVSQFKHLGKKFPIADVRKLIAPSVDVKEVGDRPDWLKDWVYVTNVDKFFRMDSAEWCSQQGFNAKYDRYQPVGDNGMPVKPASAAALQDYRIEVVTQGSYIPWAGPLHEEGGVSSVNTYRPSSVPQAVPELDAEGTLAVETVLRHLSFIVNGREEVLQWLTDWIAWNIQNPGVKVRWAPLIKGIQGDGKTLVGSLLMATMGRVNVNNVSSTVLSTDFTSWGVGSAVALLEEIKLSGHNRYDIYNRLKPFITNDTIEIHGKNKNAEGNVTNVTNYIAFTNFNDALPLDDVDRRYAVIFSPFASIAQFAEVVREACSVSGGVDEVMGAYFNSLHEAIYSHGGDLRRYFLDHKISHQFRPNGHAPMTEEKLVMIGMAASDEERAIREALVSGAEGLTPDLFSSSCLTDLIQDIDSELTLNTSQVPKVLQRIGFSRMPVKVKWRGKAHVIWGKRIADLKPDTVRRILDSTVVGDLLG